MDQYQYQGIPVIHDEIDIDEVIIIKLQMTEDFKDIVKAFFIDFDRTQSRKHIKGSHLIIIPDKHSQH